MKGRYYLVLAAVVVIAAISASYKASSADAQTERPRSAGPSSTPTPTTAPTISPKATPNPEDEIQHVDTELVNLNVRVIDRNNRPVNNLSQAAFKVFEEGQPQHIEYFSTAEVPTNYTMVLDNSGSLRQQLEKVIEAGKILVNSNKPQDEASIIRFISR